MRCSVVDQESMKISQAVYVSSVYVPSVNVVLTVASFLHFGSVQIFATVSLIGYTDPSTAHSFLFFVLLVVNSKDSRYHICLPNFAPYGSLWFRIKHDLFASSVHTPL